MKIFNNIFKKESKNVHVVLPEIDKKLPQKYSTTALSTSQMIEQLTDDKLANCINHPNLLSENPKKYFVVKDLNAYYKTLNWDDGTNFLVNEFTLNLQWKLENRVK